MNLKKTIDGKKYTLRGPNAILLKWSADSFLGKMMCAKTGLDEQGIFKALSKENPEEQIIEAKKIIQKLWYAYPEFGPYPFLDALSEMEHKGFFYGNYRDHVIHQLKVFLLGLYIFDQCSRIKNAVLDKMGGDNPIAEFLRRWTLCALSHDIGYVFENEHALNPGEPAWAIIKDVMEKALSSPLSVLNDFSGDLLSANEEKRICRDNQIANFEVLGDEDFENVNGDDVLDSIAEYGKKTNLGTTASPFRTFYNYALTHDPDLPKRKRFRDHGIAGAFILFQTWHQFRQRVETFCNTDHALLSSGVKNTLSDLKEKIDETEPAIIHAGGAIALHNITPVLWNKFSEDMVAKGMTLERFCTGLDKTESPLPFVFLLMISDALQEWDRYRYRAMRNSDNPSTDDQDFMISVEDNRIYLDYREDHEYRNPATSSKSRFFKTKNTLKEYLDPDAIEDLIQWKELNDEDEAREILPPSKNQIFIISADEDVETARHIYNDLEKLGMKPWLEDIDVVPGQTTDQMFRLKMEESDYVLALMSKHSLTRKGMAQKQLKKAMDIYEEYPPGDIFLIPIQIDSTKPQDETLRRLKSVKMFESYEEGFGQILRVIAPEKMEKVPAFTETNKSDKFQENESRKTNKRKEDMDQNTTTRDELQAIESLFIRARDHQAYERFYSLCDAYPDYKSHALSIIRRYNEFQDRELEFLGTLEKTNHDAKKDKRTDRPGRIIGRRV